MLEILETGKEYRPRRKDRRELFVLASGYVCKIVVAIREDHILLVDVKRWKPNPRRLREIRQRAEGLEGPREDESDAS